MPMDKALKTDIILRAKEFFKTNIVESHLQNTKKLIKLKEFNINPFLTIYLANFLSGEVNPKAIAKALVYPRVLGSSINTSFGSHIQGFCSSILPGTASTTSGIDIEFIDQIDGRKKYCQIKAGPNTINKDDVETIINHFVKVKQLARTNKLSVNINDMIVGILYGTKEELSTHYKTIDQEGYPVFIGQDFWYRLTGDQSFYFDLISAVVEVTEIVEDKELHSNTTVLLDDVINKLAAEIEQSEMFKGYFGKVSPLT